MYFVITILTEVKIAGRTGKALVNRFVFQNGRTESESQGCSLSQEQHLCTLTVHEYLERRTAKGPCERSPFSGKIILKNAAIQVTRSQAV